MRNQHPDLAALVLVAASTGCWRGELCALRWSDVDLEQGQMVVRRSISDTPGRVVVRSTKTGRIRRLALDPLTLSVFQEQRRRGVEWCEAVGAELVEDAFVWSQSRDHSEPWRPDRVTDSFRALRDRAGLPKIRFHHLRHFAATQMLAGGVDVRTAAARLGHAEPNLTLRTYSHLVNARDEAAAALLGGLLTRRPES